MKKLLIVCLVITALIVVSGVIWHAELFSFKNNVQKYTALNIRQNTGMKRQILESMETVANLLPE